MNKFLGLESSFVSAFDRLNITGQGVHNEDSIQAAIFHRCPTYFEHQPIMDDSPSTHPLQLNTQSVTYSDNGSESASSGDDEDNDGAERSPSKYPNRFPQQHQRVDRTKPGQLQE
ncbi:hypothetical protein PR001_g25465 [Phytophthora rubi]|uniref:Uncharacterized protein n=1 Tax=Phytophthora rubi TaxID=129364 RepID=A0A6A3I7J1_9STRA|nr:hypothetical protein PR001_g25465 [Phytophthora rubi]